MFGTGGLDWGKEARGFGAQVKGTGGVKGGCTRFRTRHVQDCHMDLTRVICFIKCMIFIYAHRHRTDASFDRVLKHQ